MCRVKASRCGSVVSGDVEEIAGSATAALAITCEHASERLPDPWGWPEQDLWLAGTHWAYDIGAAALAQRLAEMMSAPAVLSRFSRILADPNRPESSPELFRKRAEGRVIALNQTIDDREQRLALWRAYHDAADRMLRNCQAPVAFAVHSFTPEYEGEKRDIEIGVLFDRDEAPARRLADHLRTFAKDVRLNEPYSGKRGLAYSVDRHARAHGRAALEIEVRQDLCGDTAYREALAARLAQFAWRP